MAVVHLADVGVLVGYWVKAVSEVLARLEVREISSQVMVDMVVIAVSRDVTVPVLVLAIEFGVAVPGVMPGSQQQHSAGRHGCSPEVLGAGDLGGAV